MILASQIHRGISSQGKKNLREYLYKKHKRKCFYCGKFVGLNKSNKKIECSTATIEHLYPKTDIRRFLLAYREYTVLSCHKCNRSKNQEYMEETVAPYLSNKHGDLIIKLLVNGLEASYIPG